MISKPKLTIEEVQHVAKLANLNISRDELVSLQKQLDQVIALVSKLSEIKTTDIAETSQVTGLHNIFREDVIDVESTLTQQEALSNANRTHNGFFIVPYIL